MVQTLIPVAALITFGLATPHRCAPLRCLNWDQTKQDTLTDYIEVVSVDTGDGLAQSPEVTELQKKLCKGLSSFLDRSGVSQVLLETNTVHAARFKVKVSLSRVSGAIDGGSFLCVVRLVLVSGNSVELIGQWAGIADNFRFLSGNLSNRPETNREGLLGELGTRVVNTLHLWVACTKNLPLSLVQLCGRDTSVILTKARGDKATQILTPNERFSLTITPVTTGELYVLSQDSLGKVKCLTLNGTAPQVLIANSKTQSIPTSGEFFTHDKSGEHFIFVLQRTVRPTKPATSNVTRRLQHNANNNADPLPVQVVQSISSNLLRPSDSLDECASKVMELIKSDPRNTWTGKLLRIDVK